MYPPPSFASQFTKYFICFKLHSPVAFFLPSPSLQDKMLSLNTTKYSPPSGYQVSDLPKPVLDDRNDVIIKVHTASINPIDVKKASGILKMGLKDK